MAAVQLHALDDLIEGDADDDSSEFVHNYFMMRRTVDQKGGGAKKAEVNAAGTVADTKA